MPLKAYATGHPISNVIMAAFAEGFEGEVVSPRRLHDGPAAMYGILRGTGDLIHQCNWIQRNYYYVDHGYFRRGHYDGYYRVTQNAMQNDKPSVVCDDRWRALGLDVRPWTRDGSHILVLPLSDAVGEFLGIDTGAWLSSVIAEIRRHTDREIRVKPKDEGDLAEELRDCYCVVTYHSTGALEALRLGIPCITLGESGATPLSWGWENIESPEWPDREPLFHWLAYCQHTLEEIRNGSARRTLESLHRV